MYYDPLFVHLCSFGHCMSLFFFFQAEDGIRDLVRSRGLGDVYKRQLELYLNEVYLGHRGSFALHGVAAAARAYFAKDLSNLSAVSYTHLTLPTSDLV